MVRRPRVATVSNQLPSAGAALPGKLRSDDRSTGDLPTFRTAVEQFNHGAMSPLALSPYPRVASDDAHSARSAAIRYGDGGRNQSGKGESTVRRASVLKLIAGLAAAGLVLTACSSGSSSSGTTTSAAGSAASSAAASGKASGSAAASGGAAAAASMTGDPGAVKLGLAYDIGGRGDQSFNDLAASSLDKAKAAGVTVVGELTAAQGEPDSAKTDRLNQLIDSGATDIIAVGFAYATPLGEVAKANPDVHFAIVDDASLAAVPNVASLTFAEEQ